MYLIFKKLLNYFIGLALAQRLINRELQAINFELSTFWIANGGGVKFSLSKNNCLQRK